VIHGYIAKFSRPLKGLKPMKVLLEIIRVPSYWLATPENSLYLLALFTWQVSF